ncbi:hypothetical protein TIFTF001_025773 [Ficus carica]|uniref:KIB1-4 beta-propeller domain-containing protein n=1 Tax=Ficus carica TaxID=3494 RepID=A0AA88AKG2_FICCA|nr:hypothetical protein TIFTF001_025773 [Ficus carica]
MTLEKLESLTDYLRFSGTCAEWHSIAKDNENKRITMPRCHQVPMLLIPSHEDQHTWSAYNVLNNEFLSTKLSILNGKRFGGSSEGWLVAVEDNFSVTLYKPFSMANDGSCSNTDLRIRLPSLFPPPCPEEWDYHVFKAIITADPIENPTDCIVVIDSTPYMFLEN